MSVRIPLSVTVLTDANKTAIWSQITCNRDQPSVDPLPCSPENFLNLKIMWVNYEIMFNKGSSAFSTNWEETQTVCGLPQQVHAGLFPSFCVWAGSLLVWIAQPCEKLRRGMSTGREVTSCVSVGAALQRERPGGIVHAPVAFREGCLQCTRQKCFKDPGMQTAPFSFSVFCSQQHTSLHLGENLVVRASKRVSIQERNTGRGGRESDGDIAELVKNCAFVVWKRWACNCMKKWLPSVASSEELSSLLWNGCFVHLDILQQSFLSDLSFKAALFGQSWMTSCAFMFRYSKSQALVTLYLFHLSLYLFHV